MIETWEHFTEEVIFNFWCNTGLISTSNSVLNNSESKVWFKIKEIKAFLLSAMPVQFQSTINELLILD